MKPVFKTLKYIGEIKFSGHLLHGLTNGKEYPCILSKYSGIHNYKIINDQGKEIHISNNCRRKYFKSYK